MASTTQHSVAPKQSTSRGAFPPARYAPNDALETLVLRAFLELERAKGIEPSYVAPAHPRNSGRSAEFSRQPAAAGGAGTALRGCMKDP